MNEFVKPKRQYFGAKIKPAKKCPSCKVEMPTSGLKGLEVCETCKSKQCVVCGKISINRVQLVIINGQDCAVCPRHYGAHIRAENNIPEYRYLADLEYQKYMTKLRAVLEPDSVDEDFQERFNKLFGGE